MAALGEAAAWSIKRNGTALFPPVPSTPGGALNSSGASAKNKGTKLGNAVDPVPQADKRSPAAPDSTLVLIQTTAVVAGSLGGDGSPTLSRSHAGSVGPVQPQAEALPSLLPTGIAPAGLGPNNIPLGSGGNVAFALQLTWQPSRGATQAMAMQSGAAGTTPRPPDPIHSDDVISLQPSGHSLGAASGDAIPAESSEVRTTARVGPESLRGDSMPAGQSISKGASSTVPDRTRLVEASGGIKPSPIGLSSPSPERGAPTGLNASTEDSSSSPASVDASEVPFEGNPQDPIAAQVPVIEKTDPESGRLGASHSSTAPAARTHTEASSSLPSDEVEGPLAEANTSLQLSRATTGLPAVRPGTSWAGTSMNDSQSAMGPAAENPDSDGRTPRVPPLEKSPRIQSDHEHAGLLADPALLSPAIEPVGAPQTRAKLSAPLPAPTSTVSQETEADSPTASQPIHEISLRLALAASPQVDVQVAERAGKIQVSVRTADPDLARSLQGNLGELVGRLEQKGFTTDVWAPVAAQHAGLVVREPSTSAESQPDNSGSHGGQPGSQSEQQESNQRQPERWEAQFEEMLLAPNSTTPSGT
jgi:Flagellar hook-length control protein FliK